MSLRLSVLLFIIPLITVNISAYNSGPLVFENIDGRSTAMGGPLIAINNGVNEVFINQRAA